MRRKLEIRNSKLEINSKSKTRISNFGFVSNFEFRASNFFFYFAFILLFVVTASCRRDMFNQPSTQPLSRNDFFQDNQMASRPLVMHTVARGQLQEDEAFYTGKIGTNLVTTFPIPVTRELLE